MIKRASRLQFTENFLAFSEIQDEIDIQKYQPGKALTLFCEGFVNRCLPAYKQLLQPETIADLRKLANLDAMVVNINGKKLKEREPI